jgi:hypothetical protein
VARVDIGLIITGANNAGGAVRGAATDVKKLGENAQEAANRLKAIQVVIAGILVDKTLEWSKALIEAAAATQGLDIRLRAFAGSAKAAEEVMGDLAHKFAATPFMLDTITQGWVKLQSAVNNNGKTTEVISAIVNDVAAMGGKDENITNLSASFQRLFAVGFASAREYKTMLEQTGLTLGDLAASAGQSGERFSQNLAHGFVSAQQFTDAFLAASKKKFGDYAENLKFTIAGAMGNVRNAFSLGLSGLGANTTINANLSALLNNIADAIRSVIGSIDQQKIDIFFDWMRRMAPTAIAAGVALFNIGVAIADILAIIGTFTSHIPQEALEFGIVGYWLFGRKGAAILGLIGAAKAKLDEFNQSAERQAQLHSIFNIPGNAKITPGLGIVPALDPKANNSSTSFFHMPTPAEIKAQIDGYNKLLQQNIKPSTTSPGLSSAAMDAIKAAAEATQPLKDSLAQALDSFDKLSKKTGGDVLGENIANLAGEQVNMNKAIDAAVHKEDSLYVHTKQNLDLVKQLKQAKIEFGNAIDEATVKAMKLFQAETQIFQLEQQMDRMKTRFQIAQTNLSANQGDTFNFLKGTSGGGLYLQFLQQQESLQEQLNASKTKSLQITTQLQNNPDMDAKRAADLQQTLDVTNQLTDATQHAIDGLSADGMAMQQLWQQLGQTMENDLANGITGLLEGTMTLGDVARQVFGDMISLSIKYLIQLAEMQLFGEVAGAAALATVLPIAAAMTAAWAPAAMAASIASFGTADAIGAAAFETAMSTAQLGAMFANGGVPGIGEFSNSLVSGPTAFGIMGEAGTEAVMPLTRVNGKLGVAASGGGSSIHLHFHSADPESNAKFVMENIDMIAAGLLQRNLLNHGSTR